MAGRRGNGEGTIYKRADGRWMAQVTLADGKRKSTSTASHEQMSNAK